MTLRHVHIVKAFQWGQPSNNNNNIKQFYAARWHIEISRCCTLSPYEAQVKVFSPATHTARPQILCWSLVVSLLDHYSDVYDW